MLRTIFSASVALLLAAGVSVVAAKDEVKKETKASVAMGKVVGDIVLTEGVGTLTVATRKSKDAEPVNVTYKINKKTKFAKGGRKGTEGTPVAAADVKTTIKADTYVVVQFELQGTDKVAKTVTVRTPRRRPESK